MSFSGLAGRTFVSVAATAFLVVVLGLGVVPAGAQTLVETDAANSNGFAPCPTTVSDLLFNLGPSLASPTNPAGDEGTGTSWSLLTNGSFGPVGAISNSYVAIDNNTTLTYMLNTLSATNGYTITNIDTFSGWQDAGRINQDYTVYYSTVANPTNWIELNSVNYSAPGTTGGVATNSTQVDLAGTLTGVAGLQFDFGAQQNGYVGYRQITVTGSALAPPTASAGGGVFSTALINSGSQDANVGLNTNKTYINAVNLNGSPLTINGVNFSGSGGGGQANPSGGNYSITGNGNTWGPAPTSTIGGQLGNLLDTFVYGGNPEQLTLSGLTPGQTYVTTLYEAAWDPAGQRVQNITATSGASTTYDQDMGATSSFPNNAGSMLRYTFVASGTSETLTVTPQNPGYTLHTYGFTTEQVFNNAWTGAGTTNWSDSNSWTVTTPNYAGANAFFQASNTPTTVNLDQPTTVGHVQFDGLNSWTISGTNTLTLQTDPGGVSVLASLAGTHTIATPVSMQNNAIQFGNGTLVLSNTVTSNGNSITVAAGTLQFGDGVTSTVPVPFDGNIANNASLVFNAPNAQTYAGVISGSGSLTQAGPGILTLTASQQAYNGATIISGGTLQLMSRAAVNVVNAGFESPAYGNGGWNYLTNSTDGVSGGWSFNNNAGIAHNGSPWVNVAPQGTQVAFVQSAGGTNGSMSQTITSTADRTYTISFEAANRPGYTANGLVLTVDGSDTVANWNYTQFNNGGSFNNYSATVELTPGTHTLTFSGTDVGVADVATAIDNVQFLSQALLPATTAVNLTSAGATLDLGGNNQTVGSLAGVANTVVLNNGSLTTGGDNSNQTFAGVISGAGGVTKTGAGQWTISGANTYAGPTVISGGVLQLGAASAIPTGAGTSNVTVSSGTLDLNGQTVTINGLNGAGTVDNTAAGIPVTLTIGNNNANGNFSGVIQNTGGALSLTKTGAGVQTLAGNNTYSGGATLAAGQLNINNAAALGTGPFTISGGTIDNTSGADITLRTYPRTSGLAYT